MHNSKPESANGSAPGRIEKILLTESQLSDRWQMSPRSLQANRAKGGGCRFVVLGRSVRYRLEDVVAWEESHLLQSTSERAKS